MVVALSLEVRVLLDHAQAGTGGWLAGPFRAAEPSWCCCRRRASLGHAQGSLLGSTGSAPRAGSSRRCDSTITYSVMLKCKSYISDLVKVPNPDGGEGICLSIERSEPTPRAIPTVLPGLPRPTLPYATTPVQAVAPSRTSDSSIGYR